MESRVNAWGRGLSRSIITGALGAFAVFGAHADSALASTTYASETTTLAETRDYINQLPKMSPGIIRVGEYTPNGMSDDQFGLWMSYEASRTYYIRLREFSKIELGTTFSGDCRVVLSGDTPSIGYRYIEGEGWQRDRGEVFIRSSNCDQIKAAARAFRTLIELDGTRPELISRLPDFE